MDVEFHDGLLGYEAIRCNTCNQETDMNRPDTHCERVDRVPMAKAILPNLCHHAEYRVHVDGQYVESVGNFGRNAQRALEFYQRRRRGQLVEVRAMACKVPGCTRRQS